MGHVPDVVAQAAALAKSVEARNLEPAGGGPKRGGQDAEQGGLAGAVVTQHGHVLARVQDQVDAVERQLGAEAMGQAVGDDHAHDCSGGVRRSGQSTNGPARNSSSVATMIAIATRAE